MQRCFYINFYQSYRTPHAYAWAQVATHRHGQPRTVVVAVISRLLNGASGHKVIYVQFVEPDFMFNITCFTLRAFTFPRLCHLFACTGGFAGFAATTQLQETGFGVLTPDAAMDALAGVMIAAQQPVPSPCSVAAVHVSWPAFSIQVKSWVSLIRDTICDALLLSVTSWCIDMHRA